MNFFKTRVVCIFLRHLRSVDCFARSGHSRLGKFNDPTCEAEDTSATDVSSIHSSSVYCVTDVEEISRPQKTNEIGIPACIAYFYDASTYRRNDDVKSAIKRP